jgi:hypothetical protein
MTKSLPGSATKSNLLVAATIKPSSTECYANTSSAPKNHWKKSSAALFGKRSVERPSLKRKILVQLDVHRMYGTAGTGKSSSAEAAANAMAA